MKPVYILFPVLLLFFSSCGNKNAAEKNPDEERLTIFNADSARADFKKGIHRVIYYGLPTETSYADSLNEKYHFFTAFDADAGCEVNNEYIEGVKEYNDEMYRQLDAVNETDWRKKYEEELAALQKKRSAGSGK